MDKIKLSDITIEKIEKKELENIFPELYELEKVIENNSWHKNYSVLNHIVSVLKNLEKVLKEINNGIKDYFNQKIDYYSKKEILFLATIFHDIAKKETIIEKDGITICPDHEEKSAEKLKNIISRSDLSENEKERAVKIVKNHNILHGILDHPEDNPERKTKEFKEKEPDIFIDIVVLAKADILGSQLKENKPEEFKYRINFLDGIIVNY